MNELEQLRLLVDEVPPPDQATIERLRTRLRAHIENRNQLEACDDLGVFPSASGTQQCTDRSRTPDMAADASVMNGAPASVPTAVSRRRPGISTAPARPSAAGGVARLPGPKPRDVAPGTVVGPYSVQAVLGEGAIGTVYRATRRDTGEIVALKVLKPRLAADEPSRRRFLHEARAASQVKHPHLVPVLDAGECQGRRYLAMRYIEGTSLERRLLAEGPLQIPAMVRLAGEIGSALDALHAAGFVHRDVKAANIMLDAGGSAWLADFGLAKGPAFSNLTQPGRIVGTLDHLAPERFRGAAGSPSTDIYALGCVVYHALAGGPPFTGRSLMEIGWAILQTEPPDPCRNRTGAPRHLSAAVLLALAKDPAARPHTASAYAKLVAMAARSG